MSGKIIGGIILVLGIVLIGAMIVGFESAYMTCKVVSGVTARCFTVANQTILEIDTSVEVHDDTFPAFVNCGAVTVCNVTSCKYTFVTGSVWRCFQRKPGLYELRNKESLTAYGWICLSIGGISGVAFLVVCIVFSRTQKPYLGERLDEIN